MKHLFCAMIAVSTITALGQDDYVVDSPANCVFLNFYQFQHQCGPVLTSTSKGKYYSVIDSSQTGQIYSEQDLWGKRIDGTLFIKRDKNFCEVLNEGRYLYFKNVKPSGSIVNPLSMSFTIDINQSEYLVMDQQTGVVRRLNRNLMKSLLQSEPDLLEAFNRSRNKNWETYLEFLDKLNARLK